MSDVFLARAYRAPVLVNSWSKAHSGEVIPFFDSTGIEEELTKGKIVPLILANRLRRLEERSSKPMMKQWAYEFDRLLASLGQQKDGHFSYFWHDDRQRSIGQFIGRRGQFARSAFLRTLALAVDLWGMPEEVAAAEAMYASPVDFSWIDMLPSKNPSWFSLLSNSQPSSIEEWGRVLENVSQKTLEQDDSVLLHLNGPDLRISRYQAEVEVISALHVGHAVSPESIFQLHEWLLGRLYIPRSVDGTFVIERPDQLEPFAIGIDSHILPVLLPAVGQAAGYFHAELISRMPYLPANYSIDKTLTARMRFGGANLSIEDQRIGELRYWNWRWDPMHDRDLGPGCAVSVTASRGVLSSLYDVSDMKLIRVWRATILSRDTDYGEWKRHELLGILET